MNSKIRETLKGMSAEERKALMEELQQEDQQKKNDRRNAYEAIKNDFLSDVQKRTLEISEQVSDFRKWLDGSADAFRDVMHEYGHLKKDDQLSYTILSGDFRLEVRSNKVKSFDERADVAAKRLMDYLELYIYNKEKGTDDPLYQLTMSLLQRNRQGALDYKSISKLYELEEKFNDAEYTAIMSLFRESNVVMDNATNYYFFVKDDKNVWKRIEISFNRL